MRLIRCHCDYSGILFWAWTRPGRRSGDSRSLLSFRFRVDKTEKKTLHFRSVAAIAALAVATTASCVLSVTAPPHPSQPLSRWSHVRYHAVAGTAVVENTCLMVRGRLGNCYCSRRRRPLLQNGTARSTSDNRYVSPPLWWSCISSRTPC